MGRGRWGDEMGRWGDGEVGRWGDGEHTEVSLFCFFEAKKI